MTTFLLGAIADQHVYTLEADKRWFERVRREARRAGLDTTTILHAPLRDYGEFHWYEVPEALPSNFSMVVCDGPAADGLKGGRVGLLPVLGSRLGPSAPVVVDGGMVHEAVVVDVWQADYGLIADDLTTAHRVYRMP